MSGYRSGTGGTLMHRGAVGAWWTSTPYGAKSASAYFHAGGANFSDLAERRLGFGVRCLRN